MASLIALLVVWISCRGARLLLFRFSRASGSRKIHGVGARPGFAAAVDCGVGFLQNYLQRLSGPARITTDLVAL